MSRHVVAGLLLALELGLTAGPAGADGTDAHRTWHPGYSLRLPPERHVVEVVDTWGYFIIGGMRFTPLVPACAQWTAGERIKFLTGGIGGACRTALIYNYRRRQTCEFSCPWGLRIW